MIAGGWSLIRWASRGGLGLRFLLRVLVHLDVIIIFSLSSCSRSMSCATSISVFLIVVVIVIVIVVSSPIPCLMIGCLSITIGTGSGDGLLGSHVLEGQGDGVSFPISGSESSSCQGELLFSGPNGAGLGIDLGLDAAIGKGLSLDIAVWDVGEDVDELSVVSDSGEVVVKIKGETR